MTSLFLYQAVVNIFIFSNGIHRIQVADQFIVLRQTLKYHLGDIIQNANIMDDHGRRECVNGIDFGKKKSFS